MDEETRKVVDKIEKLMRLAGSNPNQEEAASALAKAQELLSAYNLTMTVVEQASGQSGKRTDEMVRGGVMKYQRSLWRHIAELNFCYHWTQRNAVGEGTGREPRYKGHRFVNEHRIVGRVVNVAATKGMSQYLEQTINRLCEEKFGTTNYFKLTSADAVAYREGIADRVTEKIVDRRNDLVLQEEARIAKAAKAAAEKGLSTATALTIAGLTEQEQEANDDFLHGEGYTARRKAAEAEDEKRWAERRERQARAQAAAEKAYAAWAAANPEEAAKEAAKERAKERAEAKREARRRPRAWRYRVTKEDMRRDTGSYRAGYDKGESVSIDPQVNPTNQRRIG